MIAVDAMGGDYAPEPIVRGAVNAARKGIPVNLFGNEDLIKAILKTESDWQSLPLVITHTSQVITMDDDPIKAVLAKKKASLVYGLKSLKRGNTDAFVSAGNSGALLIASSALLGRVQGVKRPAVGAFLPKKKGSFFCLDLGANVDVKAEHLEQFAVMGDVYARLHNIVNPRIALLSNGHEPSKGSSTVRKAYSLLLKRFDINFVGNVESREVFDHATDVLVCDGFHGNIFLKAAQGTSKLILNWLKAEAQYSFITKIGLWLARKSFRRLAEKTNYAMTGGALLLGVKKPVILAHGRSSAKAIENAIQAAYKLIISGEFKRFNEELELRLAPTLIPQGSAVELGS